MGIKAFFSLILVFLSALALTCSLQPSRGAAEWIYIRADGSVDPSTAPISTLDNLTYTLTGNISGSDALGVVVERNNITIDGQRYAIEDGINGFRLSGVNNVKIKNTKVVGCGYGIILLAFASNNTIVGNSVIDAGTYGISLYDCSNNTIAENNIAGSYLYAIHINDRCQNNSIYHNNFFGNANLTLTYEQSTNIWDNGVEGNYWGDHNPPDADMDKIGDLPYIMDENNTDRYPLIYPFECYELGYVCSPDLNKDGIVNILDVVKVAKAFDCVPGDSRWSAIADMDLNEVINIVDVSEVAKEFGACEAGFRIYSLQNNALLISDADVLSYNWTSQQMAITPEASLRLNETGDLYSFTGFVIKIDGEEIYRGIFRQVTMSATPAPPRISILYPSGFFPFESVNYEAMRMFWPFFEPPSDQPVNNTKIFDYFEKVNKLEY